MSGSDIIPPILPVHAVEDMFLEWQSPEAKAGFDMLWRMRQHIVEQCVLSYAPRAWERLSKADEANRARALAVSIDNACRGIDREIALYLANYSHPAQLFQPPVGAVTLHAALGADLLTRAEVYLRSGVEPPVRAWCECYRRDAVSDECENCDKQFGGGNEDRV